MAMLHQHVLPSLPGCSKRHPASHMPPHLPPLDEVMVVRRQATPPKLHRTSTGRQTTTTATSMSCLTTSSRLRSLVTLLPHSQHTFADLQILHLRRINRRNRLRIYMIK